MLVKTMKIPPIENVFRLPISSYKLSRDEDMITEEINSSRGIRAISMGVL